MMYATTNYISETAPTENSYNIENTGKTVLEDYTTEATEKYTGVGVKTIIVDRDITEEERSGTNDG